MPLATDLICGPYGPYLKVDYTLINALAQDEANRAMQKRVAGIKGDKARQRASKWTVDEYNRLCERIDSLSKTAAAVFAQDGGSIFPAINKLTKRAA